MMYKYDKVERSVFTGFIAEEKCSIPTEEISTNVSVAFAALVDCSCYLIAMKLKRNALTKSHLDQAERKEHASPCRMATLNKSSLLN